MRELDESLTRFFFLIFARLNKFWLSIYVFLSVISYNILTFRDTLVSLLWGIIARFKQKFVPLHHNCEK